MFIGDIGWWIWADRRLRALPRARIWRSLLALFAGFQLAAFVIIIGSRWIGSPSITPASILAIAFVWHLLILPSTVAALLLSDATLLVIRAGKLIFPSEPQDRTGPASAAEPGHPSRRQILAAAAVAVPPLLTGIGVGRAMLQLNDFRIHRIELPIPNLPLDLDGVTIAQVSDIHVGRFTRARELPAVVEATNQLRADLVLMTGDLIDYTLSDLPTGIDMVQRLDPRHGLFAIEGNHDLFESRRGFEDGVRAAGIPLLLNESRIVNLRGIDVQILGIRWGTPMQRRGSDYEAHTRYVLSLVQPGAFPILLAHHPHAFDLAADAGIPLTLAGHTHGGQLMLNERLGAGPVMFKYWSGLYRRKKSALFVSNGVGNWFPLRVHAPAEIVHITLRRTPV